MKLIQAVDKYLENPYKIHTDTHRGAFYPSSASCKIKNVYGEECIIGGCLRSVYWKMKSVKPSNPMNARGARITGVGKMVERFEVEQYKQMGIWRGNNIKFFNEKYNISGEADAIVWDKDRNALHGIEIKSGYDYKFRSEVIGSATRRGQPKMEHLLQTMIYVDYFKLPFNIIYIDRGNAARAEYEITLNTDGTPSIDGNKLTNGLSIPRCLARLKELGDCLNDNTLPRRDFQLRYPVEKLQLLRDSRRLNKKDTEEFDKNKRLDIGDWHCSYCDYKDHCWGRDGKNE